MKVGCSGFHKVGANRSAVGTCNVLRPFFVFMVIKKLQWEQSSPVSWQLTGELGTHIYATIVEHAPESNRQGLQNLFTLVCRTPGQIGHFSDVFLTLIQAQEAAQSLFEQYVTSFLQTEDI